MMDDKKPRRRRNPFDDILDEDFFQGFGSDFTKMHDHINHIMRDMFRNFDDIESRDMAPGKGYVYGFSMRTGPDGKPIVNEFGNVPRMMEGGQVPPEREPLIDVLDGKDEITVIAELPGVDRQDIDLNADSASLSIDVGGSDRRYHKHLKLPAEIMSDDVKASYKNGVLEVKLKRARPAEKKKNKIKVD
ncbi:archaeal heat shock protein Hsp20 [Candidatus Altiarchaeota archaeon]